MGTFGRARAFDTLQYDVPGNFWVLAQPSGMACWATVFTMLKSWRSQREMSIDQALATVGQRWVDIYRADTGLSGDDKPTFLSTAGLVAEPPQSFSIQGWETLLRNYGPIWITTDEAPGAAWAIHARIITGIHGDGTPEGTKFKIVDPAGGRRYEESIAVFIPKYEEEVIRTGFMRVQVVHWQADGRSEQRSISYGRSLPRARGLTANGDLQATVQRLQSQGVVSAEIDQFLAQVAPQYAQSASVARALSGERTQITLPGGQVLSSWQAELLLAAITAALPGGFVLRALIPGIQALCTRFNVTVGVGPAITGGFAVGLGAGAGLLFAPNNQIGFYGTLSGVVGAIVSISATMQVTIIKGGPANFGGNAMAAGLTVGVDAPVGPTGGVWAIFSNGQFAGVTFEVGVSAGLSPLETYAQFQHTATSLALV
jgi:hypothetical protein